MAKTTDFGPSHQKGATFELTRTEAVELIALLSGQLAKVATPGNHAGAAPRIKLYKDFVVVAEYHFVVTDEK